MRNRSVYPCSFANSIIDCVIVFSVKSATLAATLQNALFDLTDGQVQNITGCSRTDSGVHANAFYCHFDTNSRITASQFVRGLNSKLPDDISVCNFP